MPKVFNYAICNIVHKIWNVFTCFTIYEICFQVLIALMIDE